MTTNKPDAIVEKKRMTLRRWLYEHSPQAENLLRRFDEECDEIIATLKQPATIDEATFMKCVQAGYEAVYLRHDDDKSFEEEVMNAKYNRERDDVIAITRAVLTAVGFKMEGK